MRDGLILAESDGVELSIDALRSPCANVLSCVDSAGLLTVAISGRKEAADLKKPDCEVKRE